MSRLRHRLPAEHLGRLRVVVLGAVLAGAGLVAGSGHAAAAPTLAPPPVPAHGAYLGAYVAKADPAEPDRTSDVATFERQTGRPLAIDDTFADWDGFAIGAQQLADARTGTMPMISWSCDLRGAQEVIDGSQDAVIDRAAGAVKAYGHPVFVRYWWEPNLVALLRNEQCSGGLGPLGYIKSWQHVRDRFRADGALNASFAWVIAGTSSGAVADQFYPGDDEVDWVGLDQYSRTTPTTSLADLLGPFTREWGSRKPVVVAETGVTGDDTTQAAWLSAAFAALPSYPQVKAVLYEDDDDRFAYHLDGPAALHAFAAGGAESYFSPMAPHEPLQVDPPAGVTARPGDPVDARITATGFPVPGFTARQLPAGLRLYDHGDGTADVRGVPLVAGPLTADIEAASPDGHADVRLTILVSGAPVVLVDGAVDATTAAPTSLPIHVVAYPAATVTLSGLPRGFRFVPGDAGGTLVGAPAPGEGGSFPVTVSAGNEFATTSRSFALVVHDQARVVSTDAVAAYVGRPLSVPVTAVGYPRPTVSVVGDAPPWVHVAIGDAGRATVSGTPTDPGVFTLDVRLAAGGQASDDLLLVTVHR